MKSEPYQPQRFTCSACGARIGWLGLWQTDPLLCAGCTFLADMAEHMAPREVEELRQIMLRHGTIGDGEAA